LRRLYFVVAVATTAVLFISCGKNSVVTEAVPSESMLPSDLTESDLKVVNDLNANSTLVSNLYKDMGNEDEPYFINGSGRSNAVAVRIPKDSGPLRVKEIEIYDKDYNLYGMTIGVTQTEFENEILKRGYSKYHQIESMGYEGFIKGNIYVGIDYDNDLKVDKIFINYLVDYNEWRGIE